MQQLIDLALENPGKAAFFVYVAISSYVAATKSAEDDAAWKRFCQRWSFLAPWNHPTVFSMPGTLPRLTDEDPRGSAMLVLLLCVAPLLGGCGAKRETLQTVIDFVRASSCAVCRKLNPHDCPEPQP